MSEHTVTADALREWCINRYAWGPDLTSDSYICPTREWLLDVFAKAWLENLKLLGLDYQSGSFDCQSFTLLCVGFARICHQRTPTNERTALAVGGFGFTRWSTGTGHKIVVGFVRKGELFEPAYLEPQSGREYNMYPEEEKSCMRLDLL